MKQYDVIVIGSGSGSDIAYEAVAHRLSTALVDKGPPGGTCPNTGCIPSKMLIYPADIVAEIQAARRLGIAADVKNIDFAYIMERQRDLVRRTQEQVRQGLRGDEDLDYFEGEGHFTAPYTLEVNGQQLKSKKIFIASGSRTLIPPIKGLDTVDYLTNDNLLELKSKPESLIVIGGGFIAVEYAHFFAAMGTRVTILEMADRLVLAEDAEIAGHLEKELGKRMEIYTGVQAWEVKKVAGGVRVAVADVKTRAHKEFRAENLLVAAGRRSNADTLKVENTGVALDSRGYIKVDEFLETSQKDIYAIGDANGQQMFTHTANREAAIAAHNGMHAAKVKMDYSAAPHAVYTYPPIASVGLTEAQARQTHKKIMVGKATYSDVATGDIIADGSGFAKAVADTTGKLLGFHIIGPWAPILIQEVINAMASGGGIREIEDGLHIHPAPTELVARAIANLAEVA